MDYAPVKQSPDKSRRQQIGALQDFATRTYL